MKFLIELEVSPGIVKQMEEKDNVCFDELLQWLLFESEEGLSLASRDLRGTIKGKFSRMIKGKYAEMCSIGCLYEERSKDDKTKQTKN